MQRRRPSFAPQPRFPVWLDALIVASIVTVVLVAYGVVANALLVVPVSDADAVLNERDAEYFAVLGATLAAGTVSGVALAALLRRSLFGFALLFLALVFLGLVGIQAATFEMACDGRNDIVRHWQCDG